MIHWLGNLSTYIFGRKKVLRQLLKHYPNASFTWSNRQREGSIILHKSYNVCIEFGLFLIRICWVVETSLWIEHQLEEPMLLRMEKTTSRHGPMWKGVASNPKRANALSPFKGFFLIHSPKKLFLERLESLEKNMHANCMYILHLLTLSLTHSLLLYQIA
jgi:hypothetical protein